MMNFIKDFVEHPLMGLFGIISIVGGYLLDYFGKSEYFSYASIVVVFFLGLIVVDVYLRRKQYQKDVLPVPIVVSIDSSESAAYMLQNLFEIIEEEKEFSNLQKNLKKYKNIVTDDLYFEYRGDLFDEARLISFFQIIRYQIRKIKESMPNRIQFHLITYKRPAIGFLLGCIFENEDVVIYQKNPDRDKMDRVASPHKRDYKTEVKDFKKFELISVKKSDYCNHVLLAVKASSHHIDFFAQGMEDFNDIIYLKAKHQGHIDLTEDWILYAREIFTVINQLQTEYKKITIAHNMPESIAIVLGMALGNYNNIEITQFYENRYVPLINLNKIQSYF